MWLCLSQNWSIGTSIHDKAPRLFSSDSQFRSCHTEGINVCYKNDRRKEQMHESMVPVYTWKPVSFRGRPLGPPWHSHKPAQLRPLYISSTTSAGQVPCAGHLTALWEQANAEAQPSEGLQSRHYDSKRITVWDGSSSKQATSQSVAARGHVP